tara:strand:- start:355 stop:693 length:339 start_codon:yes stop_codon:yes gene_type:complete
MEKKLRLISGKLYILSVLFIASFKAIQGYFKPLSNLTIVDSLLILITALILLVINWFRARRFKNWKSYFFTYLIFSILYTYSENSNLQNISVLVCLTIVLLMTYSDADIKKV